MIKSNLVIWSSLFNLEIGQFQHDDQMTQMIR